MLELEWSGSTQTALNNPIAESPTNRITSYKNLCVAIRHSLCQDPSLRSNSKVKHHSTTTSSDARRNEPQLVATIPQPTGMGQGTCGFGGLLQPVLRSREGWEPEGGAKTLLGMRCTPHWTAQWAALLCYHANSKPRKNQ